MKFTARILCFALPLLGLARSAQADALSELRAFSVFDNVDLDQLAKGEAKTMHGPPMSGRYLSVQSVYVTSGSPAQQVAALKAWDATKHRELKVFLHGDLPGSPAPGDFAKLQNPPSNRSVESFEAKTKKMSSDLQISKDEASKFSGDVGAFWSSLLSARARAFVAGGSAAMAPYDHTGNAIRANEEFNALLKNQDKVRKQFSGLLGASGIGRGAGSIKPDLYWELLDVDDQGVVTLGVSYNRAAEGGAVQAADALYYASGGYYVALTLYQLWPVTANGKPSTLVWRGDLISSASLADLHGVERLGSESAMMKDITKAVALFRKDTGR